MGAEQRLNRRDVGDSWAGWAIAMLSQVLSDQLKPYVNQGRGGGGEHIMPSILLLAPRIFRPS